MSFPNGTTVGSLIPPFFQAFPVGGTATSDDTFPNRRLTSIACGRWFRDETSGIVFLKFSVSTRLSFLNTSFAFPGFRLALLVPLKYITLGYK
jgi:hypothetical protein